VPDIPEEWANYVSISEIRAKIEEILDESRKCWELKDFFDKLQQQFNGVCGSGSLVKWQLPQFATLKSGTFPKHLTSPTQRSVPRFSAQPLDQSSKKLYKNGCWEEMEKELQACLESHNVSPP
jgi:hypothetical protein